MDETVHPRSTFACKSWTGRRKHSTSNIQLRANRTPTDPNLTDHGHDVGGSHGYSRRSVAIEHVSRTFSQVGPSRPTPQRLPHAACDMFTKFLPNPCVRFDDGLRPLGLMDCGKEGTSADFHHGSPPTISIDLAPSGWAVEV